MKISRRKASVGVATAAVAFHPLASWACLNGKWKIRCPNGHDDFVRDITCNHRCERCRRMAFENGEGNVVCPDGHVNHVKTGTDAELCTLGIESLICSAPGCGKNCRFDPEPFELRKPKWCKRA